MRKQITAILLLACMANWGHSQVVPAEVTAILNNYFKDSTSEFGFLYAKEFLHLKESVLLKDLKLGHPIEVFSVKYSVLDTCSDTIPFYELIESIDNWYIPVMFGDQPLYELRLVKKKGKWEFIQMSDCPPGNMWDQLLSAYPESVGISPILVLDGLSRYFYFKQKGPRKIYYIRPGYQNDSLENVTPGSIRDLDDSKKLIKHWRKQGKSSNNTLDKVIQRYNQDHQNGGNR